MKIGTKPVEDLPGRESRLRDTLAWTAMLALAVIHMLLFTRGYRLSADDVGFLQSYMSGTAANLQSGSMDAHLNGRIGMFLLRPLNNVGAYLSGYYPMRLLFVAMHYSNLLLFSAFASRALAARITLPLFLVLVVMHPLAFEHMPPNAYPLQNTVPFMLILASRIGLMRIRALPLQGPGTAGTHALLLLLFAFGMLFSEYATVFGIALLLTECLARLLAVPVQGLPGRLASMSRQATLRLDVLAVLSVLVAYLVFRWFNPSQYDGNSPDGALNVGRAALTAIGHIVAGTTFGQLEPGVPQLGWAGGLASVAAGVLAAYCALIALPRISAIGSNAGRLLLVSACAALCVVLPLAVTLKQQQWCVDGGGCGFVDSRVAFYWVGITVLAALAMLMRSFGAGWKARWLLLAASLGIGLVSAVNYANNAHRAEQMQNISSAWQRASVLGCLPQRVPQSAEALKRLVDPRGEVMFHPTISQPIFWKQYVEWLARRPDCPVDQRELQRSYSSEILGINALEPGETLKFSRASSLLYLGADWSPESWGAWSVGHRATFSAQLPQDGRPLSLSIRALRHDVVESTRPVTIRFNGKDVASLRMSNNAENYLVDIPASLLDEAKGVAVVEFLVADPVSPRQAGSGVDTRQLGVGLIELEFALIP